MPQKSYSITTPLYYVNAKPHIGHAYTNILCDTFARFHRLRGEKVFFLTGTDEHGTKIEKAARESKKEPRAYVDEMVPSFKELWKRLGIEYDYFIRTTDAAHKKVVQKILEDLESQGEIYKANYKGWYCTPCESFWTESQLNVGAVREPPLLHKYACPDCGREVQELAEENYFFRLSKYQNWLIEHIKGHADFIRPEIRRNEIVGFLREPLEDLCITRPRARLAWGIDYPSSKEHVVYVWFDALINYVSAAGYTLDEKKFKTLWPADIHMVGKDILRQHAVYWPIMLKAIGVEMPRTILAHGWWTLAGAKVSKSRGNIVDPLEVVNRYGVDAFRYFLLREVTIGFDGAFSEDLLAERYTSDLANNLGNLWFRLATMLEKYSSSALPAFHPDSFKTPLIASVFSLWKKVEGAMLHYDPREALSAIWEVMTEANQFVEEKKPWVMAKETAQKKELDQVLIILAETAAHGAFLLRSFLPQTAGKILMRLKFDPPQPVTDEVHFSRPFLTQGARIERGDALFPRLEEES